MDNLTPAQKVRLQLEKQITQDAIARARRINRESTSILPTFMGADGKIKRIGHGEQRTAIATNLFYSEGEEMRPIPVRGGLPMVDNKPLIAPSLVPIPVVLAGLPIKILLQNGSDLYIGGDRDPEQIYTIPSGRFLSNSSIKSTGLASNDYVVNFVLSPVSGNLYDFCSIKNGVFSSREVDLTWTFTADVLNSSGDIVTESFDGSGLQVSTYFDNDFCFIVNTVFYSLENQDIDGNVIGYKDSQLFAKSRYVDVRNNLNADIDELSVTLADNGITSSFASPLTLPLNQTKRVDGQIVIFAQDDGSGGFLLSGGTSDILYSTGIDNNSVIFQSYLNNTIQLFTGAALDLTSSYPSSVINPPSYTLNVFDVFRINLIDSSKFTLIKELKPDGTADVYVANLGANIIYQPLQTVDYTTFNETYTLLCATSYTPQ
jgi:hypothetical protein